MATIVGLRRGEPKSIIADEYQSIDIVDGQQRITTLTLLYKAIGKALADSNEENGEKIKTEIEETLIKPDQASTLLVQTNHDSSDYFAGYLRDGETPDPRLAKTVADREILSAIKECEEFVQDWKEEEKLLVELYIHIKNQLTFIFYEIADESLVYTVYAQ